VTEAMNAEFDTVAEWTAEVAEELGHDYYVPAGCRGSGSPAALDWLIDQMRLTAGDVFVDCGAGVGGPAAYVARARSVRPVLVEPEAGACRAAMRLFGFPVVRADGSMLPLRDSIFDAAWSLGVLCTTPDQLALLEELRRVVRPGGPIGLLAFVAQRDLTGQIEGNTFPTNDGFRELLERSGLRVEHSLGTGELPAIPDSWNKRVDTVTRALTDRHGDKEAWRLAERQSSQIARLLSKDALAGELLVLRHV